MGSALHGPKTHVVILLRLVQKAILNKGSILSILHSTAVWRKNFLEVCPFLGARDKNILSGLGSDQSLSPRATTVTGGLEFSQRQRVGCAHTHMNAKCNHSSTAMQEKSTLDSEQERLQRKFPAQLPSERCNKRLQLSSFNAKLSGQLSPCSAFHWIEQCSGLDCAGLCLCRLGIIEKTDLRKSRGPASPHNLEVLQVPFRILCRARLLHFWTHLL